MKRVVHYSLPDLFTSIPSSSSFAGETTISMSGALEADLDVWDVRVKVEENGYYWKKDPVYAPAKDLKPGAPLVVELFSGCGGTSLGFEMAGCEIALGADIHRPSVATFRKNHPNSAWILGDVKKISPALISELVGWRQVDVLVAGVPCQGFSLNNRKRHDGDERNFLFREFIRFVEHLKPKCIVVENVSGMRSAGNGTVVKEIEAALSESGGMTVSSSMLSAHDYGVPQKRNRLIFVGVRDASFDFSAIKKTHGPGRAHPYVTVADAIGDLPSLGNGESAQRYASAPKSDYQRLMRANAPNRLTNHRAPKHPRATVKRIASTKPGSPMYPRFKQRIRLAMNGQSPTQVSGGIRPQFQFGHPSDPRGLSIRERCRLQSFPDRFIVEGGLVQGRVQTGNAVPPLLAKAVALAIKRFL